MCKPVNGQRILLTKDTASQTDETMTYHIDYISNNEPCCSLDLEESVLTLDIDRFSEMEKEVISHPFRARDVNWKLKVQPREHFTRIKTSRCLGVFLQCCPEEGTPSNWNCYADFELIMVSKKEGVEDYVRAISHTFNKDEDDWGYSAFLMMKDVSNPACGYIDNDTVTLEVTVRSRALRQKQQSAALITDGMPFVKGVLSQEEAMLRTLDAAKRLKAKGAELVVLSCGKELRKMPFI